MSKKISKSPEMLRREAEIKKLQVVLKKKQSSLKGLKTRLQNMKADIEDVQHKFQTQVLQQMEKMDQLRQEIADLAERLVKTEWLTEDERSSLQALAGEFGSGSLFGEDFEDFKEQKARMEEGDFSFEEEERARLHDLFQQFQVMPEEEEKKNIRKVFLKLSNKFHPDKAKNEKEEASFHEIMQDINKAYQANDIQALLEMERLYLLEDFDFAHKALTIDVLKEEIDRLQKELTFIEGQVERTREEIKNLRQSELGNMLTSVKRAEREGEGLDDLTANQEHAVDMMTRIRDGMKESLRTGGLSPLLQESLDEMLFGLMSPGKMEFSEEDMLDFMMEMDDEFTPFTDPFDDLLMYEEVENPQFPVGSSVEVTYPITSPFLQSVKMIGWQGRVQYAYYDENGQVIYAIVFDGKTIAEIPDKLIEGAINEMEDFQTGEIPEYALTATRARDTEKDAFAVSRKRYHSLAWSSLPEKQQKRLQKILLRYPSQSDIENWKAYLSENLTFPFETSTRPMVGPREESMTITNIDFEYFDEEYGYIATVKVKNDRHRYKQPLFSLKSEERSGETRQILDDYFVWAEEWLLL